MEELLKVETNSIIKAIEKEFSVEDVCELFDTEILDWDFGYDEDEIDSYDSRFDFYRDYANGEGEFEVFQKIVMVAANININDVNLNDREIIAEWLTQYTMINFE